MAIVLECITEEQRSIALFFCGKKDSMQRIFIKKCFLFTVGGKCLLPKAVHNWVENFSQERSKVADDDAEVAGGFDALVNRWDKCISVGGGYVLVSSFLRAKSFACS
jgi:hypothetical protein